MIALRNMQDVVCSHTTTEDSRITPIQYGNAVTRRVQDPKRPLMMRVDQTYYSVSEV